MKVKTVLEARFFEFDDDPDYDVLDSLGKYLLDIWKDDYVSVYDALENQASEEDWDEIAEAEVKGDIRKIKFHEDDLSIFLRMSLDRDGKIRGDIQKAVRKYVVGDNFDDWKDSDDAVPYVDDYQHGVGV